MAMLAERRITDELMDAADLPAATYDAVLADLAAVNAVTMAARPTLAFLDRALAGRNDFTLLDVGFGHGDMLRRIARWGRQQGKTMRLVGVDLNPRSEHAARSATDTWSPITYTTGDYADLAGQDWDCVISSLVVHHMSHEQLIAFLRFMDTEARTGWLVNDLHRHAFAYHGYPILARLLGWHPIVRQDGQTSIARSYRPEEWPPILAEAGISGAEINRVFPFRLCVSRVR